MDLVWYGCVFGIEHFPGRSITAHSYLLYEGGGWIPRLKPLAAGAPLVHNGAAHCRNRQCLKIN